MLMARRVHCPWCSRPSTTPHQLLIISYALIELLEGQTLLCFIVFTLTAMVMVGLSEIAIAMSDPFGEDQADFNVSPLPPVTPHSACASAPQR
jgi:hypothetical protein